MKSKILFATTLLLFLFSPLVSAQCLTTQQVLTLNDLADQTNISRTVLISIFEDNCNKTNLLTEKMNNLTLTINNMNTSSATINNNTYNKTEVDNKINNITHQLELYNTSLIVYKDNLKSYFTSYIENETKNKISNKEVLERFDDKMQYFKDQYPSKEEVHQMIGNQTNMIMAQINYMKEQSFPTWAIIVIIAGIVALVGYVSVKTKIPKIDFHKLSLVKTNDSSKQKAVALITETPIKDKAEKLRKFREKVVEAKLKPTTKKILYKKILNEEIKTIEELEEEIKLMGKEEKQGLVQG